MLQTSDDLISRLKSSLTKEELEGAIVYALESPVSEGKELQFPGIKIEVTKKAFLAFVDRVPMANWGHTARYILISQNDGETQSYEARLPPFQQDDKLLWQVVYKAPAVPDSAIQHM